MTKEQAIQNDLDKAYERYQIAVLLDDERLKRHAMKVILFLEKQLNS